jgi:5-formyltetrahydrofolate cyclo-ligase
MNKSGHPTNHSGHAGGRDDESVHHESHNSSASAAKHSTVSDQKRYWRSIVKQKQESMSAEHRIRLSQMMCGKLMNSRMWHDSTQVALYYGVGQEVHTEPLLAAGWSEGKRMYLPKTNPRQHTLTFYEVERMQDTEVVYFGLREPRPDASKKLQPKRLDLIVVPGLVFDKFGYRIGYGAGYYDRFLPLVPDPVPRIALAFQQQVLTEDVLPAEAHDIPVDLIITEKRQLDCTLHRDDNSTDDMP